MLIFFRKLINEDLLKSSVREVNPKAIFQM